MQWFEINLNVPEALKESVVNRLFELGAEGVSEGDSLEGSETIRAFFAERHRSKVDAELKTYLESVAEIFPELPPVRSQTLPVESDNWAERYKEFYVPQKLTRLFFLKPAWDSGVAVPDGMVPIVMEPGQAFGTGLHPSTRLCMRMLERAIDLHPVVSRIRLIDVGTGTGILAIVAAKLGVGEVTAIDNDAVAVATARENLAKNDCERVELSETPLSRFRGPFDVIVSNILLETHKQLVDDYRRLLAPGGQLILSGLLAHQKAELLETFRPLGFTLDGTESLQEWMALSLMRRDETPTEN
jgi:ribosomal protein L11 methyltransferase